MLDNPPLPPLFRFANMVGAGLAAVGLDPIRLRPEALKARAAAETGLSDFGDSASDEALDRLCASARDDAALTLLGRIALREIITEALSTRLLRIDSHKRRPQVFNTPLVPPLIVVGLPRSGTTHLHRLLALAPDARTLPFWELRRPIPPLGVDRRREILTARFNRMQALAPDLDKKHKTGPDEPEECMMLLDSTLVSLTFFVFSPVYGYLDWLISQDPAPLYSVYREHLQLFQAEAPGRRLTLKAPAHTPFVDALLAAVPEAHIVQTHREPVTTLGSAASLFYTFHRMMTERVDRARLGVSLAGMFEEVCNRTLAARDRLPAGAIHDVLYDDLVEDPLRVVSGIYDNFGLHVEDEFAIRLRRAIAERPQHAYGVHTYDLADFDLDPAALSPRFDAYRARFLR